MGLITLTNIEDGQDAVANALNERFGKIVDTVNGNIDSQNLKNNAVTREKIAPQSVTSDKLFVDRYIDENGWTVVDYGTTKTYSYVYTITNIDIVYGARKDNMAPIKPPVGRTRDDLVFSATWYGGYSGHAIPGIEAGSEGKIQVMLGNQYSPPGSPAGATLKFNGSIFITATERL